MRVSSTHAGLTPTQMSVLNSVVRHGPLRLAELQTIDIVCQMLGHIASVVRSSDPPAAVDAIGMGELKARLMRRNIP